MMDQSVPEALFEEISSLRPPNASYGTPYSGIDYTYDNYICYGCVGCDTGTDFCRGSVYEGLRITGVKEDYIVKGLFGKNLSPLLAAFLIHKFNLDSLDSYWIKGDLDYYGEEIIYGMSPVVSQEILDWFYAFPNSRTNILKGWDADVDNSAGVSATEGLAVLMDNGKYVLPEDKRVPGGFVEATMYRIPMKDILIPNEDYFATAQGEPPIEVMDPDPVAGVVAPGYGNKWVLVQGYERFLQGREAWGEDYRAWFVLPEW